MEGHKALPCTCTNAARGNHATRLFSVHIHTWIVYTFAPSAPLREPHYSRDIFSRQAAKGAKTCIPRGAFAFSVPLRETFFSLSRKGRKDLYTPRAFATSAPLRERINYKLLTILRMLPSFSRVQLKFTSKPSFIPVKRRYVRVCLK